MNNYERTEKKKKIWISENKDNGYLGEQNGKRMEKGRNINKLE